MNITILTQSMFGTTTAEQNSQPVMVVKRTYTNLKCKI